MMIKAPQRTYYKKMKEVDYSETPIPVYSSNALKDLTNAKDLNTFIDSVYSNKEAHHRYLRLVPFFTERLLGFHNKQFVIRMSLLPTAEALKVDCLTNSGIVTKHISLSNLIPVIYEDFLHNNRRKMLDLPTFVDHEMIYYNVHEEEYYVFDKEAIWEKEGVEHPALELTKRFNEKLWYDRLRIV